MLPRTPAEQAVAEETEADGRLRTEVTFQDPGHADRALWHLAADGQAPAPQWLRDALRDPAAAFATRYGGPS